MLQTMDEDVVIQQDHKICLKTVGTCVNENAIFAVGSLVDNYLSLVN